MALDFPATPTLNQTYTYGTKTWTWNGTVWQQNINPLSGTIAIGTVTTGAAGSSAIVTNSGTSTAAILNFTIPQGVAGTLQNNSVLTGVMETMSVTTTGTVQATTYNLDLKTAGIWVYGTTTPSTATAGFTLNIRGDATTSLNTLLPLNDSISVIFENKTGAVTTSYPSTIQIDGVSLTTGTNLFWQGGIAPTLGNASSVDIYTFNIQKISSTPTYIVLASMTRYA
jgi:hypothetical protein